jgi:hypothetical protein
MKSLRSLVILSLFCGSLHAADWKPVSGKIMTRWAKDVSPETPLPEYPRPQMVREKWQNLNGLWDYAITPLEKSATNGRNKDGRGFVKPDADGEPGAAPKEWQGQILVPFCIESALSGVGKTVGPDNRLWYRRSFKVPADWKDQHVLLNFGAVDWHATVWLNGKQLGDHRGGYDPFSFDLTDALKNDGDQELIVAVWDPSQTGVQPCGKQVTNPGGIFYTAVTGIWQTVWIEPVNEIHFESLGITTDVDRKGAEINIRFWGRDDGKEYFQTKFFDGGRMIGAPISQSQEDPRSDRKIRLRSTNTGILGSLEKFWSTDSPFLYGVEISLTQNGREVDRVKSYFALRETEVKKDAEGVNRLFLNNKPLFQYGPLDQGWWPDGLYTAPTDEALKFDIEMTKKLGFNMCRKHVKVEPARWYHWCDQLGLLVWQDMPSSDNFIGPNDPDITRSAESEKIYRTEWEAIINSCRNYGSIVAWVPFNEGWGQFKTNEYLEFTKKLDPTRIVDGPSGWADRKGGDMHDMHNYPGPGMFPVEENRASVLGEFGGLGLPLPGHTWVDKDNWGYRSFESIEALNNAYADLANQIPLLIGQGLAAAVYTQTTDVEVEVNGFMSYDREVVKFDVDRMKKIHDRFYGPPPKATLVTATSETEAQTWKYTLSAPSDGWFQTAFDDAQWKTGPGGFGTANTPGTHVRTEWNSPDIWCRREFEFAGKPGGDLVLRIHHDEDCEVYLNGHLLTKLTGYSTDYTLVAVTGEAAKSLIQGHNVLAVHCHQTGGGQYIDVGLMEVKQP